MAVGLFWGVYSIDGLIVNSTEDGRYTDGVTNFLASDITSLISGALVAVRLVTSAWAGIASWKCAFIMLEKSSLDLKQFNRMVSARVPWPLNIRSGRFGLLVTAVLLLMLPSTFIAPLLSGAAGWQTVSIQVDAGTANITIPESEAEQWFWYQQIALDRGKYTDRAAGLASLAWANIEQGRPSGCRHVVVGRPVNSTVENALLPCIKFHGISWYGESVPSYVSDVIDPLRNEI